MINVVAIHPMKDREPLFDNVKIILMMLVVFGHVLAIGTSDRFNLSTYNLIYSFHMPLFIFVSGYFTKIRKEDFWYGILKIFETFVVFSLIAIGINAVAGKGVSLRTLIVPKYALWYLLCLIWWRVLLYFIPERQRRNHMLLIAVGVIVSLAGGFVPIGSELCLQRTFSFMSFFILGYVARQEHWIDRFKFNKYLGLFFLIAAWVVYFIINVNDKHFLYNNRPYYQNVSVFSGLMLRIVYLALACLLSCSFLSFIPRLRYRWTHFGALTLFIYMWHTVILTFRFYLRDKFGLPVSMPFCLLYTAITLAIVFMMSKLRFFHWMLNPFTSFLNLRKR